MLNGVLVDLFSAGTETASTAVLWALLLFLHFPHVQDKCHQEVAKVLGKRAPSMRDRTVMTYLEAIIMEILRFANVVPMSVPHGLATDVTFRGYVIPRDAMVIPNLDSALSDPEVWSDPENFRPERFISPDGKLVKPDEFIPFSMGKCFPSFPLAWVTSFPLAWVLSFISFSMGNFISFSMGVILHFL
jgi:cytochrome P450